METRREREMDGGQTQGGPDRHTQTATSKARCRSAAAPGGPSGPRKPTSAGAPLDGPWAVFSAGLREAPSSSREGEVVRSPKYTSLLYLGHLKAGGHRIKQIARREQTGALDWVVAPGPRLFKDSRPRPWDIAPSAPPAWVLNGPGGLGFQPTGLERVICPPSPGAGPGPGRRQSAVRGAAGGRRVVSPIGRG